MNNIEAAKHLKQAEQSRANTCALLHTVWFPLVFWGATTLLSGLAVALWDEKALEIFWPIAGTLGFIVMAVYFARRENQIGIKGAAWPYIVLALSLMVGAGLASSFGSQYSKEIGSWLVVSVAYLGFAYLARNWWLASLAVVLGLLAIIGGATVDHSYVPLALAYGLSFVVAGLVARKAEKNRG